MIIYTLASILLICICLFGAFLARTYMQLLEARKQLFATKAELKKASIQQKTLEIEMGNLKAKFQHDVLHDALTGLSTRQVFEDRLIQAINQSKRYQMTFGVLFLDIDSFKLINDALGHDVGDELLKAVAARLEGLIRKVDSMSRFAGDEFVFILSQLSKPEAAAYVAQRLLSAISQPFKIHEHELFITASIGIATFPTDGQDVNTLLKNSDNALHQAKARGRNTYQFYQEEMHALSQRELRLSSGLQQPDVYRQFVIFYQPQINVGPKKVTCLEALLFWQHPDFGLIPLQDFLRLAENNGRFVEIGEWLLRNTFQQISKWNNSGGFQVSQVLVRISLRQLENPNFVYRVSQILQAHEIEPESLVLEISEAFTPSKMEQLEKAFHMLKHLGVQIALKDFGAGYLSLQYLKRFPVDYLKIASSLVQDISINKDSCSIVKMIIALAQSLQITVIAEGVESQNQKEILTELGCPMMIGNLFTAPLKAEEFTAERMRALIAEL